ADAGEDYLRHTGPGRIEEHRRATQHAGRLQPTDAPPADRRRSADPLGKLLGRQAGVSLERLDDPDIDRIVEFRAGHRAPPWDSWNRTVRSSIPGCLNQVFQIVGGHGKSGTDFSPQSRILSAGVSRSTTHGCQA